MIEEQLRRLLSKDVEFAVLYIDLNNFKAYNDKYGFERGDQVLLMTAETLSRSLASEGQGDDFLGHIGGDDFIIITSAERADRIANAIIGIFDQEIRSAFSSEDLVRGYIQVKIVAEQWKNFRSRRFLSPGSAISTGNSTITGRFLKLPLSSKRQPNNRKAPALCLTGEKRTDNALNREKRAEIFS